MRAVVRQRRQRNPGFFVGCQIFDEEIWEECNVRLLTETEGSRPHGWFVKILLLHFFYQGSPVYVEQFCRFRLDPIRLT